MLLKRLRMGLTRRRVTIVILLVVAGCVVKKVTAPPAPDPTPVSSTPEPVQPPAGDIAAPPTIETVEEPEVEEFDPVAMFPYPLDEISREVPEKGRVVCPEVELVRYRGDTIRYQKAARVYVGFRDRLRIFEEIVRDTAIEIYGRPPTRIVQLGTYYCRRIRLWPTYLSEHGLGNAIDIEGFDFDWVSKKKAPDTPRKFRAAFKVRLDYHWDATKGRAAVHSRFLRLLAERVVARYDLFRVMLGPAEVGHDNHFHFDVAPWRIVNIFEGDQEEEEAEEELTE